MAYPVPLNLLNKQLIILYTDESLMLLRNTKYNV